MKNYVTFFLHRVMAHYVIRSSSSRKDVDVIIGDLPRDYVDSKIYPKQNA